MRDLVDRPAIDGGETGADAGLDAGAADASDARGDPGVESGLLGAGVDCFV